jgi:hypothetical protein
MSAFTIMAHALAKELAARGVHITLAECEEILRRVVDHAGTVASGRLQAAKAGRETPE